jgi:tripartite-type tricarboxylate transporter receptor subunit TctC
VFDAAVTALQTARGGQARAFAMTGPRRSPAAPGVPTWREIGVDAEMLLWQALFVPAATPAPVRAALHAAVARAQADPAMQRRWAELGVDRAMALPPAESEAYVAAEVARWERIMAAPRPAEPPPAAR